MGSVMGSRLIFGAIRVFVSAAVFAALLKHVPESGRVYAVIAATLWAVTILRARWCERESIAWTVVGTFFGSFLAWTCLGLVVTSTIHNSRSGRDELVTAVLAIAGAAIGGLLSYLSFLGTDRSRFLRAKFSPKPVSPALRKILTLGLVVLILGGLIAAFADGFRDPPPPLRLSSPVKLTAVITVAVGAIASLGAAIAIYLRESMLAD